MGRRHLPLLFLVLAACTSVECRADPSPSCSLREDTAGVQDSGQMIDDEIGNLSAGRAHVCLMLDGRDARCWGDNSRGQLSSLTNLLPGVGWTYDDWRGPGTLSVGGDHSCVYARREISCWGNNDRCQLATGSRDSIGGVVHVELPWFGDESIERRLVGRQGLALGDAHTCAVEPTQAGARVWCWGENTNGQLGTTQSEGCVQPAPVPGLPESSIAELQAGSGHTCVMFSGNFSNFGPSQVWCWGDNTFGQAGSPPGEAIPPTQVTLPEPAHALAVGGQTSCAVVGDRDDSQVYCWGKTGIGTGAPTAIGIPLRTTLLAISVGADHACALAAFGHAFCWGSNQFGQVSSPPEALISTPVQVPSEEGWLALAAGDGYTCGITRAQKLLCWGTNSAGQLGRGGGDNFEPMPTTVLHE